MQSWILWLLACSLTATAATPLAITTVQLPEGVGGKPYSVQLQASGGTSPYTWAAPGLAQFGLQLDPTTGVLRGTPVVAGFSDVYVVSDSAGQSASKELLLQIWEPVQGSSGAVNIAQINTPYLYPGLFRWPKTATLVSGALPPGISLLSASTLSGTPTQAGIFTFAVTATGAGGDVLTCTFTLAVAAPITITLQPAYTLTMGQPASIPWVLSGGVQPFQVKVTGQPDGMYLDSLTRMALIGTPYESGTFSLLVEVSDPAYTRQQASTKITVVAPLAVGSLAASARNNNAFTASLNATGGAPPYGWRITSGSLPAGLNLSLAGQISGVVTAPAGSYPFTVSVTDARGSTASGPLNLPVAGPAIATQTLPHAQVGASYSQTLKSTGGTPSYNWSVSSGDLPPGLLLDRATGTISGSPAMAGQYSFTVRVADNFASFSTAALSIVVDAGQLSLSVQALASGNVGSPYQASLSVKGGITPYQFVLDTGTLPDGIFLSASGDLSGVPTRKGTWTFTIRVADGSQQVARVTIAIQVSGPVPQVSSEALVNAASFLGGLAPGGYISIFGQNLASTTEAAPALPLPFTLGNVTVLWNGAPLALIAVSPLQINAQLPFNAAEGKGELKIASDGVAGATASGSVQAAVPGLFQVASGFLLAINEDGTLNSSEHPAPVGSIIIFYATGCGAYDAPVATGGRVPIDRLYPLALPYSLSMGGSAVEVLFAGAAPALGSGLVQINARIPNIQSGEWPAQLTVAGVSSNGPHLFVTAQ